MSGSETIIEAIEDGMIERLKLHLPSSFYISSFPADTSNFDAAMMNASALVHFSGSRYATTTDMNQARQSRDLRFTIILRLAGQHGGRAGYGMIELVRKALQNVPVAPGATPIKIISDQLTDQNADQWDWQIDVSCMVVAIASHTHAPRPNIPLNRFQQED